MGILIEKKVLRKKRYVVVVGVAVNRFRGLSGGRRFQRSMT